MNFCHVYNLPNYQNMSLKHKFLNSCITCTITSHRFWIKLERILHFSKSLNAVWHNIVLDYLCTWFTVKCMLILIISMIRTKTEIIETVKQEQYLLTKLIQIYTLFSIFPTFYFSGWIHLMYRRAIMLEHEARENENFVAKLGNLPVVSTAWIQACTMYQKTKDYNMLLRATCNMAEGGVQTVVSTTKPYVDKYQPQSESYCKSFIPFYILKFVC